LTVPFTLHLREENWRIETLRNERLNLYSSPVVVAAVISIAAVVVVIKGG
jgi:hypothetical protein